MDVQVVKVAAEHDHALCEVIKTVGAEYGAIGDGFGPSDPEVLAMSEHYNEDAGSLYLVAIVDGEVVGGGGIAPFGEHAGVCELKKLFLLPKTRGLGLGKKLTEQCLAFAKQQGYQSCYLDTLSSMAAAIKLYELAGFEHLAKPYPGTLHNGCDVWMLKTL